MNALLKFQEDINNQVHFNIKYLIYNILKKINLLINK